MTIKKNHRIFITIFFIAIILLRPMFLQAQEHSYMHYDVQNGLAGSTVYSMAQDKQGFVWFGTETGLSRFDGSHFRNFTTKEGLPDNEILKIFVDSRNRVWLLPFKNSIAYYWHGKIFNQQNDTLLRKLKIKATVESIVEDDAGNILLLQSNSLQIIDKAGKVTPVENMQGTPNPMFIQAGLNKRAGYRVSLNGSGLTYADVRGDKLVFVKCISGAVPNNSLSGYISPGLEIYRQRDSVIFFYTRDSTKFFMSLPKGFISISSVNDSSVLLNTYTNTYLINIRQKRIVDSFLKGQTVNSVIEDSEGDLWFSTLGQGVYRLGSAEVDNYFFKGGSNNLAVFCIRKFDSTLYFGGDHLFLYVRDLRTGRVRSGEIDSASTRGRIMSLVQNAKRSLLVGTDVGLFRFEGFAKKAVPASFEEAIKSLTIIEDTVLLECSNFFVRTRSLKDLCVIDTIWRGRATNACRTAGGTYYIGTLDGLYSVDKNRKTIFLGDRYKVFATRIAAMTEAPDGTCWIATNGEGIAGYRDGRIVARVTEENGLTSNICRSVFVSGTDIWVGTDKGLNKITLSGSNYKIIPFTRADGLPSDIINDIYVKDKDVFVGTSEGVTFFNEDKLFKRSGCIMQITGISISDRTWTGDTTGFILAHKDNNIQFDFVGISFKSAGSISYRYRLSGLDTTWKTTTGTSLSYPSLPSGAYELQITATNKFGIRSTPIAIKFEVDKLLWEKGWFRLSLLLTIAILIFLFFNYRLKVIRKKERKKAETAIKMAELEQMALRSQMNPHFIFNCLNSIQKYVIYKDVLGANEFITKFSNLIRQTLDISSRPFINLYEEINYITTYLELEKGRFEDKFIYEITLPHTVDMHCCVIPPMILQPYIENAIRHGIGHRQDKKGKIRIAMEWKDAYLVCIIEDNGVGRKKAGQFKSVNSITYQSVGMTLVEKRIDMLNKTSPSPVLIVIEDMKDPSGAASGTRILLHFPPEIVLNK